MADAQDSKSSTHQIPVNDLTGHSEIVRLGEPQFTLAAVEKTHILNVLKAVGGNKAEAARRLGIGIATLYRKIKQYGV